MVHFEHIAEDDGLFLVFDLHVWISHQEPWKGSVHNCPSDMDWYGYTEVDGVDILSVHAYDSETGQEVVPVPERWSKVDPRELFTNEQLIAAVEDAYDPRDE